MTKGAGKDFRDGAIRVSFSVVTVERVQLGHLSNPRTNRSSSNIRRHPIC